jgi:phenylacetate-CoA ligase
LAPGATRDEGAAAAPGVPAGYVVRMLTERRTRALSAYRAFVRTRVSRLLDAHASADPRPAVLAFVRATTRDVPAYREFLRAHGVDGRELRAVEDLEALPPLTKENYVQAYPLAARCRDGDLASCDMIAVSSGSTGEPTIWPRFLSDELAVTVRFEQVFREAFDADRRRTLAVVCFPLGTWVGGMFTASCCRHLAVKGYPLTVVTPGNNKAEILRSVRSLAPMFEQTVLLGYPPFLKDVVDAGTADGVRWAEHRIKLVLAGEVFSEEWRSLMMERAGMSRPLHDSASLYGTADAGVLGNETPVSVAIRRFLAERPDAARAVFGEARLPTLVQYDPFARYFEAHEGKLLFSGENGVPLVRYRISDTGGVVPYATMMERLLDLGFDAEAEARRHGPRGVRPLPFVYVFGRSHFAVSYYGANVFPETVSIALEQPGTRDLVTGKFVMEVVEDAARDPQLVVAVELVAGVAAPEPLADAVADAIATTLRRLNSEFASYVPLDRQRPRVTLWPAGHPEYFPAGVKHRYSRK